jgi:membrane protease YdiL (CAAX protease family)
VLVGEGIGLLLVAAITWVMSRVEGRPVGVYGLGGPKIIGRFLAGAFWGLLLLSLLVLILFRAGLLIFDARLLHGSAIALYALEWAPAFLAVSLLEGYLVHGYLLYTLSRGLAGLWRRVAPERAKALGFWTAALAVSIGFGLLHSSNKGESPIGLLSAALISMIFCFSLWRTGSLWWAVGLHAAWDWGESFLYGVADSGTLARYRLLATHPAGRPLLSGGTTGPEGSIFVTLIVVLFAVVIVLTLRDRNAYARLMPSGKVDSAEAEASAVQELHI